MKVFLAYLAEPKYGGWPTFTAHLHRGLRALGHQPMLVKEGNRTEQRLRSYGRKINYQNLSAPDFIKTATQHATIITAVDKHHHALAAQLIAAGVPIVIHDPTELKTPVKELASRAKVIVIRETMLAHLPAATFIKHPYCRDGRQGNCERKPAATISRIDFDKHTEVIVRANLELSQPIDIYGSCNTVYAHFKLKPEDPAWETNYKGRFKADDLWAAKHIAEQYERIIDMSAIKKDGGGTQYTFLEAADAGAALILNQAWQPTGGLASYAHTATSHTDLVQLCRNPIDNRRDAAERLLREHDAKMIAEQFLTAIR